jgi:hypothetical protein
MGSLGRWRKSLTCLLPAGMIEQLKNVPTNRLKLVGVSHKVERILLNKKIPRCDRKWKTLNLSGKKSPP